jgi:hypothetical protein
MMHELFEELDAFDPNWQKNYKTILEAVSACGYPANHLFNHWLNTPEGWRYIQTMAGTPDYLSAIEEHQKALEAEQQSLPFGYGNLGSVRGNHWQ